MQYIKQVNILKPKRKKKKKHEKKKKPITEIITKVMTRSIINEDVLSSRINLHNPLYWLLVNLHKFNLDYYLFMLFNDVFFSKSDDSDRLVFEIQDRLNRDSIKRSFIHLYEKEYKLCHNDPHSLPETKVMLSRFFLLFREDGNSLEAKDLLGFIRLLVLCTIQKEEAKLDETCKKKIQEAKRIYWNSFMFFTTMLDASESNDIPSILQYVPLYETLKKVNKGIDPNIYYAPQLNPHSIGITFDIGMIMWQPTKPESKADPISHIFSKVMPYPAQTRMFKTVAVDYALSNPVFKNIIIEIIINSLIGNFPFVESKNQASFRFSCMLLRYWYDIRFRGFQWLKVRALMSEVHWLVVRCVQLFFYYTLQSRDAIYHLTKEEFHVDECLTLVNNTVHLCRNLLDTNGGYRFLFGTPFNNEVVEFYPVDKFLLHLKTSIKDFSHVKWLALCKAKESHGFLKYMKSVIIPACQPGDIDNTRDNWMVIQEKLYGLNIQQMNIIDKVVSLIDERHSEPEKIAVALAETLGANPVAIRILNGIIDSLSYGNKPTKDLIQFNKKFPFVFRIIQYFQMVLSRKLMFRFRLLPDKTKEAQIAAIIKRRKLPNDTKTLPASDVYLYICPVCYRINSYIRPWAVESQLGVSAGWINTMCRLSSCCDDDKSVRLRMEYYCNGNKTYKDKKCGYTELVKYPLLGRMILYGQSDNCKMISICPTCGVICVYNPLCIFNENGFTCYDCTIGNESYKKVYYDLAPVDKEFVSMGFQQRKREIEVEAQIKAGRVMDEDELEEEVKKEENKLAKKKNKQQSSSSKKKPIKAFANMFIPKCCICKKKFKTVEEIRDVGYGVICCENHLIGVVKSYNDFSMEVFFDTIKAKEFDIKENPECISDILCQCNNLVSTCSGQWNYRSMVTYIKQLESNRRFLRRENKKRKRTKTVSVSFNKKLKTYFFFFF